MAEPADARPRVLAVDDHPMVREGLRSMLSGAVEAWDEAGSGEDALRKLASAPPDLVLLDLQLPDVDGLTLLRRIKAAAPRTSVLVISMHDRPEHVREAMVLGAAGYVLKGITRRELLAAVRAACAGESVIAPPLLKGLLQEVASGARAGAGSGEAAGLTRVERELLAFVAQGLTNKEIAVQLRWSVGTVKKYVQRILEKLQVSDRTQAAVEAVRRGLIGTPPPS
jgi:DNA-binding NarL/FixJ family response regulator